MRPTIITIVNHKGGVLKTTSTVNLGAALARLGKRVLVVDLDAQMNLTIALLGEIPYGEDVATLYEALMEESSLDHLITNTSEEGLDIIPCHEDFVSTDMSLASEVGREHILLSCLEKTERLKHYDFVLLDNTPAMSLVVVNSLAASDFFLVPCSAEYLPMTGLTLLGNSIGRLHKVAPRLQPLGVFVTLFASNERICNQVVKLLREKMGRMVFDSLIRVNTKAKTAPSKQQTIFQHENSAKGRGTEDYTALAREFLKRVDAAVRMSEGGAVANG